MIITCESCGTKFKIDPSKVANKDTIKVRCSRCRHVFVVNLKPEEEPKKSEKVIVLDDSLGEEIEKIAGTSSAGLSRDSDFFGKEEAEEEPPKPVSEPIARKKASSPLALNKIIIIASVTLVLLGFLIYKYVGKHSKPASSVESSAQQADSPSIIFNPQTQAFFIENVHVGQILVVQGEAINESKAPVSFILLEGKVIGTNGKALLSQRFYAGNLFTKEELAQLPVDKLQERMMRREGESLSNVRVKPGDKVPFMVVFYNLPPIDELSDYAVEFVSAEIEKPSASPATGKGQTH